MKSFRDSFFFITGFYKKKLWYFFLYCSVIIIPSGSICFAQSLPDENISLELVQELTAEKNNKLITATVKVTNHSNKQFSGALHIDYPPGFKIISHEQVIMLIEARAVQYVSVKILNSGNVAAGENTIFFIVENNAQKVLVKIGAGITIKENNTINMELLQNMIFVNAITDSVFIKIRVHNQGNKTQPVTVVAAYQGAEGRRRFTEKKTVLPVAKDSLIIIGILAGELDFKTPVTNITITGFAGNEKELFSSAFLEVQLIRNHRNYSEIQPPQFLSYYQNNSITASYRRLGNNLDMFQLMGAGVFDLPTGNIEVKGNLTKVLLQSEWVTTNSSVSYNIYNNKLVIGNMDGAFEIPVFGRGVRLDIGNNNNNKKLRLGIIDNNYNLFSSKTFFSNGYGAFIEGELGKASDRKNHKFRFITTHNPFDEARHKIAGADMLFFKGTHWTFNINVHGAYSNYYKKNTGQLSGAGEIKYSGIWKNYQMGGAYFFSSDYFPGSRRGVKQIQQTFNKTIHERWKLFGNFYYVSNTPRYFQFNSDFKSNDFRSEIGVVFPQRKKMGLSVSYQQQHEASNLYNFYFTGTNSSSLTAVNFHRLTEQLSWISPDRKHLITLGLENGLAKYPDIDKYRLHFKINTYYTFKWFNFTATYQKDAFFLSEYISLMPLQKPVERFFANINVNKEFFKSKLVLNSRLNYSFDQWLGKVPSMYTAVKYNYTSRVSIFGNVNWNSYKPVNTARKSFVVMESGIVIDFKKKYATTGKKATINGFVFYDKNGNGICDEGEEAAAGYIVSVNNITFITDAKGIFSYSSVPFGTYKVAVAAAYGWFFNMSSFAVNKYKTAIAIPLQQAGSLRGGLRYVYDAKVAVNFKARLNGITFVITQNGKIVQKITSDEQGKIMAFLPTGEYLVELQTSSLPENTVCDKPVQKISVTAASITTLPDFIIDVKQKIINIKRFG